jgi:hypothetical protein
MSSGSTTTQRAFFGEEASTLWNRHRVEQRLSRRYRHVDLDIRDRDAIDVLFRSMDGAVKVIVHTAARCPTTGRHAILTATFTLMRWER